MSAPAGVVVRRAADRLRTDGPGRTTRHGFSFAAAYDPARVRHGRLVAANDDHLDAGAGYDAHRHRGVDVVTWVLSGAVDHDDPAGGAVRLLPGTVQRVGTGAGTTHAEHAAPDRPAHLLQWWLALDDPAAAPATERGQVAEADGWTVLAGPGGAVGLGVAGARLLRGRVADDDLVWDVAALAYLQVVRGPVSVGAARLGAGDAVEVTGVGRLPVRGGRGAEVLAWGFDLAP